MDNTAIKQIQESSSIPDIMRQLESFDTAVPIFVAPSSMEMHDLEECMPNAAFYRMRYATPDIDCFIDYNKSYGSKETICFIDDTSMSAKSVFDLGSIDLPGHKKHTAVLSLKKTSMYRSLLNNTGQNHNQKAACEFLEDFSDNITAFKGDGKKLTNSNAIQSLRNLTIESAREINSKVEDFGESMSAMERVEAKNKDELPAIIEYRCEPYNGLAERTFKLRVSILTGGDRPAITFRIIQHEKITEEMVNEFKAILESSFDSEIKTFIGVI